MSNPNNLFRCGGSYLSALVLAAAMSVTPAPADVSFSVGFGNEDFYFSLGRYDYFGYEGFDVGFGGYGDRFRGEFSYRDILGDYGRWMPYGNLGLVWVPYVDASWRPYSFGRWVWCDYGWTWVAYEPWGYLPHHYGRWIFTSSLGWVWVPGYEWGPAWVEFAYAGDVIGWGPLAPSGYHHYVPPHYASGPQVYVNFVFVNQRYFGAPNCADYVVGPSYVRQVVGHAPLRRLDRGPDRLHVERVSGRRIEVAKVESRTVSVDGRRIKLVSPVGVEDDLRRHAPQVTQRALDQKFVRSRYEKVRRGEVRTNQETVNRVFGQEQRRDSGERWEKGEIVHDDRGQAVHRSSPSYEVRERERAAEVKAPAPRESDKRWEKGEIVHDSAGRELSRSMDRDREAERESAQVRSTSERERQQELDRSKDRDRSKDDSNAKDNDKSKSKSKDKDKDKDKDHHDHDDHRGRDRGRRN